MFIFINNIRQKKIILEIVCLISGVALSIVGLYYFHTYYYTHSLGPIIHITGLRPISVIGLEGVKNERYLREGFKSGQFGIEMVTLENALHLYHKYGFAEVLFDGADEDDSILN